MTVDNSAQQENERTVSSFDSFLYSLLFVLQNACKHVRSERVTVSVPDTKKGNIEWKSPSKATRTSPFPLRPFDDQHFHTSLIKTRICLLQTKVDKPFLLTSTVYRFACYCSCTLPPSSTFTPISKFKCFDQSSFILLP